MSGFSLQLGSRICPATAERAYRSTDGAFAAVRDRRTLRYAGALPAFRKEDRERLIARSLDCGGRVAQAWRELQREGAFSAEMTQRFIANPKKKSYIPEIIRREIAPEVERLLPVHRGPREHELRGAHFRRDYSTIFAGDSCQADGVTCPVYWFEANGDSPHGYRIMRGQFILMIDERSLLALGFALNSEPTYNSRIIRSLITRVHDDYGLPRRRFKFERGIWRAKILRGDEVESEHTEKGLREFRIHFSYTNFPRGKQVEGVLRLFQNEMERLPGYCGRDEMHERFERLQKKLRMAQGGTLYPGEFLMNKAQWMEKISEILERYNQEPQQGRQLSGLSPLQAWNRLQAPDGLVKLGPQVRYLLAHHKLPMMVQRNGITLRSSLGGGVYCNEITGRFVRQRVQVWCDPDNSDYIAITSLDGKQGPFVIPRLDDIPAIDATREQIAAGRAQIGAHNGYAKTLYRTISTKLAVHHFRKLQADASSIENGERLRDGLDAAGAQKRKTGENLRRLRSASTEINFAPKRISVEAVERTATGFELMAGET